MAGALRAALFAERMRNKVSRQSKQIRLECARNVHGAANAGLVHVGSVVDVADQGDTKAVEGLRETVERDVDPLNYRMPRFKKEPVNSCGQCQRRAAGQQEFAEGHTSKAHIVSLASQLR